MKIVVKKGKKIGDIQSEFNHLFPYLKLEFYRNNHSSPADGKDAIVPTIDMFMLIKDYDKEICIDFSEMTTVKELERKIGKELNVHVRVFRKFGKAWLPVALTSDWTLKLQNEQGEALVSSPG